MKLGWVIFHTVMAFLTGGIWLNVLLFWVMLRANEE